MTVSKHSQQTLYRELRGHVLFLSDCLETEITLLHVHLIRRAPDHSFCLAKLTNLRFDVMARHGTLTWRLDKEQPPADMRDDKNATTTADHTHTPLPSLAPSIPCPDSDRCDTAGVPVPPSRRSAPAISRFHPVLGWRTILHLLVRRATESIAFSVSDRNASWSRAEDDLLVQALAKCSNSNILGRGWIEVAWGMPGRLPQQCQERYRLAHILAELTFVFLRVTFRGSPFIHYAPASSLLCVYNDSRDSSSKPAPSPSLCYSLTHAHRSIGYRNQTQPLAESAARLMYLRVYDSRDRSRIYVCMTAEIALARSHPTRPYTTRSHTHTGPLVIATKPSLWLNPPRD
jgi:hypothetical protein